MTVKRDARGRFVKGAGTGGSKPGPRSPKAKAKAWRRAVEATMGGREAMDPVDLVYLDGLTEMVERAHAGTMGTNERREYLRALQVFKASRGKATVKRMTPRERWQAKKAAEGAA